MANRSKVAHTINAPTDLIEVTGSSSVEYCGFSMYEYTFTTSSKRKRLNIVYDYIEYRRVK